MEQSNDQDADQIAQKEKVKFFVKRIECYLEDNRHKRYPPMDFVRLKDHVTLQFMIPGVRKEDLSIDIHYDRRNSPILTIKGKVATDYRYENYEIKELPGFDFQSSMYLPLDILDEQPRVSLADGILKLSFNTSETGKPAVRKKKIEVE